MIQEGSLLWQYLSPNQRKLALDGMFLIEDCDLHPEHKPSDYSYLVFPYAKMYEGFLKQLFFDLGIIGDREYKSDHFRIGKALSPHFAVRLHGHSAFNQLEGKYGKDLALKLWYTWKEGRNLVFHYFPHNFRSLEKHQALNLIRMLVDSMDEAVRKTHVHAS